MRIILSAVAYGVIPWESQTQNWPFLGIWGQATNPWLLFSAHRQVDGYSVSLFTSLCGMSLHYNLLDVLPIINGFKRTAGAYYVSLLKKYFKSAVELLPAT